MTNDKDTSKFAISVVGPTAVGKTAVSVELAWRLKCDIVSADSRQFFKEMNIGTAKPSSDQLTKVRHHFVNSRSINEPYDAAAFGEDAFVLLNDLLSRERYVVVCGGSGLYIKALFEGFDDIPDVPAEIRQRLIDQFSEQGLRALQEQMKSLDPDHYQHVDVHNPHRLIRALEVRLATGKSISAFRSEKKRQLPFSVIKLGLELPREELYERIGRRMDQMIEDGLFEEAESLYERRHMQALQTVGYQEAFDFFEGRHNREEAIRLMKRNSRRYAKRQLTWFKRDPEIKWFHPRALEDIFQYIENYGHK